MKSLLVCSDFSESSEHAAEYACMFARQYHFKYITLFHAYRSYIPAVSLPMKPDNNDENYNFSIKELKDLQEKLSKDAGHELSINIKANNLSLGESINHICQDENADLVVMGMKGKSNIGKAIIGSNVINVSENSYYPVLIIPNEALLEPIRSVLIACDLSKLTETIPTGLMNEVLTLFNVPLTVLNVDYKNKRFSPETPVELHHVHHLFDKYNPEYAFTENKNIPSGILEYAEQHDISLIIAFPKNYNFFDNFFHKSTTANLIYHSRIPLLTLHAPN